MIRRTYLRYLTMIVILTFFISLALTNASSETSFLNSSSYINVRAYGAKGDAITNDTAAVRAAVAAAKSAGKTVFFPAGLYKISESVEIPAGVNVEGITSAANGPWQNLYDGESKNVKYNGKGSSNYYDPKMNPGSWVLAINGSNNIDAGATFQLRGNNTVRKIGFINMYCPPLYEADIIPTPPVIGADINKLASTKGIVIEDISLSNPYIGIAVYQGSLKNYNTSSKLSGKSSGPIKISNIMGAAMYRGISVIGANGKVNIDNIQFNYATYGTAYVKQHWNYCVDIDIAASSNVSVTNVLSFGAQTGLKTSSAFSGSAVNITASNLNLEGEKTLVLNASGKHELTNCYLLLTHFSDTSIEKDWAAVSIKQDTASSVSPVYNLTNFVFQDSISNVTLPDIQVDVEVGGKATVNLTNATMWHWNPSDNEPIIRYKHNSGSASKFTVTNLALCTTGNGLLATVGGSAYKSGELTFKYSRFPTSVMGSINSAIKFIDCTKYRDGVNTLYNN